MHSWSDKANKDINVIEYELAAIVGCDLMSQHEVVKENQPSSESWLQADGILRRETVQDYSHQGILGGCNDEGLEEPY